MYLLESVGEYFNVNTVMKEFQADRQFTTIHNLVNKLRSMGVLIDKRQKHKCRVLAEEKLDGIGARLEHILRKSLKRLSQETGV
jgi:hypothetical protein